MSTKANSPFQLSIEGDGEEVLPYDVETVADDMDAIERVRDNAAVIRSVDEAADLHEATGEADENAEQLEELREVVDVINNEGTWSPESFALLSMQIKNIQNSLGIPAIALGVTMDDVKTQNGKVRVSVEEMSKIIDAINSSSADLEERSITALVELINALGDALPKAGARLSELNDEAESKADQANLQPVTFSDPTTCQRLVVNNEVPVPLSSYVNEYCKYGDDLLTRYAEVSFQGIMQSSVFQQGLCDQSVAGFWESIEEKFKQIKDPRGELTNAQMAMSLPGAGPLFQGSADQPTDVLTVRQRMINFVTGDRPVSLSDFSVVVQVSEETQSMPALQPSEIRDCVRYLGDLHRTIDVKATADACKAAWVDVSRTIRMVRETMKTSDDTLLAALDGEDQLLPKYLSTLFTLSAWPVLNYLTNLVLFTNAFVDYAKASLRADVAESVADQSPQSSEETVTEDVSETAVDGQDGVAAVETEPKPTEPDEIADTGETPDQPQDATGDGERAVVENVEETIQEGASGDEEAAGDEGVDVSADADDGTTVDVSATDDGTDAADVGAGEGEGESSDETDEEPKPEGEEAESEEEGNAE